MAAPRGQLPATGGEALVRDVPTIVLDAREDVYAFNDDLHGFRPNQVTPFDDLVDADI